MRGLALVGKVVVLLLLGLQGWTQYVAHQYGYQAALGDPLWTRQAFYQQYSLYAPWKALAWVWQFDLSPGRWWLLGSGGGLVVLLVASGWVAQRWTQQGPPPLEGHGSTKWATGRDVRKAGLR